MSWLWLGYYQTLALVCYCNLLNVDNKESDATDVDAETSKLQLTLAQEAAVRRRVDTLNATIRRRRQMQIVQNDAGDLKQMFVPRDGGESGADRPGHVRR